MTIPTIINIIKRNNLLSFIVEVLCIDTYLFFRISSFENYSKSSRNKKKENVANIIEASTVSILTRYRFIPDYHLRSIAHKSFLAKFLDRAAQITPRGLGTKGKTQEAHWTKRRARAPPSDRLPIRASL